MPSTSTAALPAFDRESVSWWRVGLLAILSLYHNELLAALIGIGDEVMRQMGFPLLIAGAGLGLLFLLMTGALFRHPFLLWPLVLVGVFILTSLFANTVFYPKSLKDWLPAHYIYLPILQLYLMAALRYTDRDILWGLLFTGLVAAVLTLGYRFGAFQFLEYYSRRSIFGETERRVVVMKYEFLYATLVLLSLGMASRLAVWAKGLGLLGLALLLALQIGVVQSRQGLIAVGVGAAVLMALDRRTFEPLTLLTRAALGLVALVVVPIALAPYIDLLGRDDLVESDQLNVGIRLQAFQHYLGYFRETWGVGFGMSSPSARLNNVIAEALAHAYNFSDLGLWAAFLQFGIVGGSLATFLTLLTIRTGIQAARTLPDQDAWRPAVLAAYFIGWMCVPVPINVFTLPKSIHFGALALYLVWYYRNALRYQRSATAPTPAVPITSPLPA
ncbi:MAG TPA: O-antigen ligase family protein [Azospirillaceae bacterium]|nr:O-antigen ligase family protein [Azospirillaceae bacterium]